jgi:hypothetical protein
MQFPILTSHLNDAYTIGQPSEQKEFLAALTAATVAWQERCVTPEVIQATKASFNQALQRAWTDLRRSFRDPGSRRYWERFSAAPDVTTINGFLKTARQPPNGLVVRDKVIDLLREVTMLSSIVRNLQSLSRHANQHAAD